MREYEIRYKRRARNKSIKERKERKWEDMKLDIKGRVRERKKSKSKNEIN